MVQSIIAMGPWAWVILGLIFLGLEIFMPGQILLWLGIAALIVGGAGFVTDMPWQAEIIIFGVLSVAAVIGYRMFARGKVEASDRPFLNKRAKGLIGRVFALDQPIHNGQGKVRINDTVWRVRGPDMAEGTRVRVVSSDGASLSVEAEKADADQGS